MVTAAEMFFPWETDNIEITTPLTTQPTSPPPLLPPSYHRFPLALLPSCVCRSLPCKGKLLELKALLTAWQVCAVCQLQPLTQPWACSGVSFGKTLETWQQALWVKDEGQWKLTGTESALGAQW